MPYNFPNEDKDSGTSIRVRHALMQIAAGGMPPLVEVVFPQRKGLGQRMKDYFEAEFRRLLPRLDLPRVYVRNLSWGTADDIAETIHWIEGEQHGSISYVKVHFVTDSLHMRRVRLVWKRLAPVTWVAEFHEVHEHVRTRYERWVYEPLAYAKYWLTIWKWCYL